MADRENTHEINQTKNLGTDPNVVLSHPGGTLFEIRVKGQLNSQWSEWLEGMEVKLLANGEMILFGPLLDQAALMGVLNKLSRLNLAILSVNEVNRTV